MGGLSCLTTRRLPPLLPLPGHFIPSPSLPCSRSPPLLTHLPDSFPPHEASLTEGREICGNLSNHSVLDTCCFPLFWQEHPCFLEVTFSCTSQHGGAGPSSSSDSSKPISYPGKLASETGSKDVCSHHILGFCWEDQKRKRPLSTGPLR